jgi:hypothetical protein
MMAATQVLSCQSCLILQDQEFEPQRHREEVVGKINKENKRIRERKEK